MSSLPTELTCNWTHTSDTQWDNLITVKVLIDVVGYRTRDVASAVSTSEGGFNLSHPRYLLGGSMERIKSACIKFQLKSDPGVDRYIEGASHADCISWFSAADIYMRDRIPEEEAQGFMTTEGRFVDRSEAYMIAKEAGQLAHSRKDQILYSEFCIY